MVSTLLATSLGMVLTGLGWCIRVPPSSEDSRSLGGHLIVLGLGITFGGFLWR